MEMKQIENCIEQQVQWLKDNYQKQVYFIKDQQIKAEIPVALCAVTTIGMVMSPVMASIGAGMSLWGVMNNYSIDWATQNKSSRKRKQIQGRRH